MSTTEILSLVKENRLLDFFEEELREVTDVFNKTATITQKCEDGSYTEEFSDHVESIRQVYYEESFEKLPYKAKRGCQKMIGDKLAESGSVAVLCKVTAEELQSGRYLFPDEQVRSKFASNAKRGYFRHLEFHRCLLKRGLCRARGWLSGASASKKSSKNGAKNT
ncbi:hypothetical protein BaRGS_00036529 [Batillaria attramentaria]|uniref:Uncharacterized protein n=1 Tax=Batillaria attramentaria TaxID=370345 RepID=A0ABD0JBQ1_9CAEN